jgi:hypothetical protein
MNLRAARWILIPMFLDYDHPERKRLTRQRIWSNEVKVMLKGTGAAPGLTRNQL